MQLQSIVSKNIINDETVMSANAKYLHSFLMVKTRFNDWITNRIQKYDFIENQDYIKSKRKVRNTTAYDYHITLDMAKELCMVENNDKGKEARRYFIECEKNLIKIGEAYKAQQNDQNFVPYNLYYSKERECIELKRAMNRMTENAQLIFNDPQTHNDTLEFLGYASRAAKNMRQLANDTAEYADNMERFIASIQKRHGHHKGVNTQCNRLPRHKIIKD